MDLSASSWTQQGCLGLAKCGILFKMLLLLVLMLEITQTLPVLKPEAPFSQSTAHALLRRTLKYTKHFCWPRVFWKNSRTLEQLWPGYGFQAWFPAKAWSPNTFELKKGVSPFPDLEQTASPVVSPMTFTICIWRHEISFELQSHVTVKLTSLCSRELHVQLFPAPLGEHTKDSVGRVVPDVRVLYVCSGVTWPSGTHPLKKQKAAWGVLIHWPFLNACTHTERSRKEEDQGHMAAHSGMAGLNALPYFTETLGDCCHPLFPMWPPVAWLQEPGEGSSPVTHCLAAAKTIFVFLWDIEGLLTAPHGMSHQFQHPRGCNFMDGGLNQFQTEKGSALPL